MHIRNILMLLALMTSFFSPTISAEGTRVLITEDGRYVNEGQAPKDSGIINKSKHYLSSHELNRIIVDEDPIVIESEYDHSWKNPIRLKSTETVTKMVRLDDKVIHDVVVNQVREPVIKPNYFYPLAFIFIILLFLTLKTTNINSVILPAAAFVAAIIVAAIAVNTPINVITALIIAVATSAAVATSGTFLSCVILDINDNFVHKSIISIIGLMSMPIAMIAMYFI